MRSAPTMKSEEAVKPEPKKPDQSVGRGVRTTLSPSRRMNTSRTDSGNLYSSGIVTVWERLFHPTRAVGLRGEVCWVAMCRSIWRNLAYGKPYIKSLQQKLPAACLVESPHTAANIQVEAWPNSAATTSMSPVLDKIFPANVRRPELLEPLIPARW